MPNIAQQDYIIIDWEGKDSTNAEKKAEVDAQLKNIYLANPFALLSTVFKNYTPALSTALILVFAPDDADEPSGVEISLLLYDDVIVYSFAL